MSYDTAQQTGTRSNETHFVKTLWELHPVFDMEFAAP